MVIPLVIRQTSLADAPAVTALLRELGYPAEPDRVASTLRRLLDDTSAFVFVGVEETYSVVGLLSLSCRPVLRLQGVAGTIEVLAVLAEARSRGVGGRLLQYAKGLASERGWVRLEMGVTQLREVNRSDFFDSRGFSRADSLTYRWSRLEGCHPVLPAIARARHRHEFV